MQMVVDKEGSVKEEQFKSVAEITWKEAITIKILLWQKRRGVVFDNYEKLPLWLVLQKVFNFLLNQLLPKEMLKSIAAQINCHLNFLLR